MKRLTICIVSIGVFLGCHAVLGQEEHLKALEPFIGDWEVTGEIHWAGKEPEPIVGQRSFEWTLGQNFIQTTMTAIDEGKPELRHKSLIGWDEETKEIKEWGFWNADTPDGSTGWAEVVTWSKADGKWYIKKDTIDEAFYTIVDQDTHKYQCKFRGKDGSKNSWHFLAKRKKKPTADMTSTPEEFKELGELMAGRWTIDVTLIADWPGLSKKKGEKVNGYMSAEWIMDQKGLEQTEHIAEISAKMLFVWDPGSKTIRRLGAGSTGNVGETVFWKDGGKWAWTHKATLQDGRKLLGTGTITFSDGGNMFIAEGTGHLDGEELLHYRDVYHRVGQ